MRHDSIYFPKKYGTDNRLMDIGLVLLMAVPATPIKALNIAGTAVSLGQELHVEIQRHKGSCMELQ